MRRVLLDTTVLVSGLLFGGRAREVIRAALRGDLQLVTSGHLARELEEVLVDKFAFSAAAAAAVRSQLALLAEIVTPLRGATGVPRPRR